MRELPIESQASVQNGVWFVFRDNERVIRLCGSLVNGKETIYVNDEQIFFARSVGQFSEHEFNLGNECYKVKTHTHNRINGPLECSLFKDNNLIGHSICKYIKGEKSRLYIVLITLLLLGLFGSVFSMIFNVSNLILFLFLALLVVSVVLIRKQGTFIKGKFVFEDKL